MEQNEYGKCNEHYEHEYEYEVTNILTNITNMNFEKCVDKSWNT